MTARSRFARGVLAAVLLAGAPVPSPAAEAGDVRLRLHRSLDASPGAAPGPAPRKNTLLALGETALIDFVLWQGAYWVGKPYAKISGDSIAQNFHKGWIIDTDPYWANQFGHPYAGALYYDAARSTGHGAYESFAVSFLGSLVWEQFMETQSPSVNDQVTTPGGGSVLGEVLYRMYRLILDSGGGRPGPWRRLGAFVVSPVAGVNQLLLGERYQRTPLLPPSWMGELHAGAVIGGSAMDFRTGSPESEVGPWASVGFHLMYGVPGTPDLRLRRPFDHFDFRGDFSFTGEIQPAGSMLIRGVLVGDTVETGSAPVGLWGLFASYDVISVPVFKVAGFGLGPGAGLTRRWGELELHGTAVVEFLFWALGGSIEKLYDRDYHAGPGAKALLDLRALYGDRLILDLIGREYWVSGAYTTGSSEDITWSRAALTARVVGAHGVTVSVDLSRRHASSPAQPDLSQHATVLLAQYTLLLGL